MIYRLSTFLLILGIHVTLLSAQDSKIFDKDIKTLQVIANDNPLLPPVIELGGDNHIEISFDKLSHEYHRYTYKIQHCNADWTPSTEIFESAYLEGFNGEPVEEYETSFNTNLLYTNYRIRIPNEDISLKISGNYLLTIYGDEENDDPDKPVLTAAFSIVEPQVGISASISTNTDIDYNDKHQQISFQINHSQLNVVDPKRDLKIYVQQNGRTDNMVANPQINIQKPGVLEYAYNRNLIFPAGNEYHKFEILGFARANMNVDQIQWFSPYYHVTLYPDKPARNYILESDQNGACIIRNENDVGNATASEYVFVHFTFESPEIPGGDVYLQGTWTHNAFTPEFKMKYNQERKAYEATQLLKLGYYNYQYLFLPDGQKKANTDKTEGNFYETENNYQIRVYYRASGDRYDQMVGFQNIQFQTH